MNAHFSFRRSAWIALPVFVLAALALSGCAGGAAATIAPDGRFGGGAYAATEEAMEETEALAPELEEYEEPEGEIALDNSTGDSSGQPSDEADKSEGEDEARLDVLPQERMIIKNGEIALLVRNMDVALNQVSQIAVDNGGYILSSESDADEFSATAVVTIAVRSEQFETAMSRLRRIAIEVEFERVSGQDVSAEFVDLESRLRNLEATRDRIAKLLEQAKTVDEALKISRQLEEIEGEIEQVKGRMNFLKGRSAMSTITATLRTPITVPATPTPTITPTPTPTLTPTPTFTPTPWSPSYAVQHAVKTQGGLLRGLTDTALWMVIVIAPYALVIGGIVYGGSRLLRRNGRGKGSPPPSDGSHP